jgi:hypothetical protein
MKKIEETYNIMPSIIKKHAGLPENFISLTNDQKRFIMEMFKIDREAVKCILLDTLEEMKGLVDEL